MEHPTVQPGDMSGSLCAIKWTNDVLPTPEMRRNSDDFFL